MFTDLEECWLYKAAHGRGTQHRGGDNPKKNTLAYHAVQHEKLAWLAKAAELHPEADVLAWIDYGVFHLPSVTPLMISDYLKVAACEHEIAIPGCWDEAFAAQWSPDENYPFWRFCGGAFVCHRSHVAAFHTAVREAALARLDKTGFVTWEVNDWRKVEESRTLPIRWYHADHDHTMFTNYKSGREG